ncbi:hypothetical protein LTR97_012217 [Elasticomyces elasticus]|uniref:Uncharacterized protein n=1 Tax=Elasticomyces elasticus TaxID=574655 RepID=A0AAN7ZZ47_9PEZI|nr:hypothetical protein LTR97_012217 [Elasticomyces elasticus]
MADVDNTGGGSREQDLSMPEMMARFRQLHAEISKITTYYKLHVSAILEQARKLTDRTTIILESLNSQYEVKRITVAEFGPLKIKNLVDQFVFTSCPREMSSNLFESVVLESATPLDNLRAGLAAVAVTSMQLAKEFKLHALDNDDGAAEKDLCTYGVLLMNILRGRGLEIVDAYRSMLGGVAKVFAETDLLFQSLEERYETQSKCSGTFGSDVDWKANLELMRGTVSGATESILLAAPEDAPDTRYYQDAWEKIGLEVGAPLARSIVAEYEEVRAQYGATFTAALGLAPEVFAYPDWCTIKADERSKRLWQKWG